MFRVYGTREISRAAGTWIFHVYGDTALCLDRARGAFGVAPRGQTRSSILLRFAKNRSLHVAFGSDNLKRWLSKTAELQLLRGSAH